MKRLIFCADGTWKSDKDLRADGTGTTNVERIRRWIAPADASGTEQIVRYDAGVGVGGLLARITGGMFGTGLSTNVLEGYQFLIENFAPGDEIFLIGFSRGAYTARSIAGLVRKCGVLRPEHAHRAEEAYTLYRSGKVHPSDAEAVAFRQSYSTETRIKCVGVWDTVGSLGIPTSGPAGMLSRKRHGFHDVRLSSHVENGFHALALDERRKPFAPTLWEVRESDVQKNAAAGQRIEQRWFVGVHSNVGGGYPDCGLSDLTYAWMVARLQECGLAFKEGALDCLTCSCEGRQYESMTWYYRAFGQYARPILSRRTDEETGEPVVTYESIDPSVEERRRSTRIRPRYSPANLPAE